MVTVCGLFLLIALHGCGGGGGNGGGEPPPANTAFNGTFIGGVTTTQGGEGTVDTLTVTLMVGSPVSGTFSSTSGASGIIAGEATGNAATFTGSFNFDGDCPGTITDGSATLTELPGNNTISFEISGSDCNGSFRSSREVSFSV